MARLGAGWLLAVLLTLCWPAAADSWKLVNDHSFYPESPLWSGGRLLYVEYAAHTVMAWDGHENRQVWSRTAAARRASLRGATACWSPATIRTRWS